MKMVLKIAEGDDGSVMGGTYIEACLVPSPEVSNDVVSLSLEVAHTSGLEVIEESGGGGEGCSARGRWGRARSGG